MTLSIGNVMNSGAWIDATTGNYAWIDGHAHWVDLPAAISTFRLPSETIQDLGKVPWDLTTNPFPEALASAMGQGMIRVRLRETSGTFEFNPAGRGSSRCRQVHGRDLRPAHEVQVQQPRP